MNLSITLTQTQGITGFIMVQILTLTSPGSPTVISTVAIPAPIDRGAEVPVTVLALALPLSPFYGVIVGRSATGVITDMVVLTSGVLSSSVPNGLLPPVFNPGSVQANTPASFFNALTNPDSILPPGIFAGWRMTLS